MSIITILCSKSLANNRSYLAHEAYKRWHTDDTSRFTKKYGAGMQKARDGSLQPLAWIAWYTHIDKLLGFEDMER